MDVKGQAVNIGIDVHKMSWQVTALVERVIVFPGTRDSNQETLSWLL